MPARACSRVAYRSSWTSSFLRLAKKLSTGALPQHCATPLMLHVIPSEACRRWWWSLAYWLPRSEWAISPPARYPPADGHVERVHDQPARHRRAHRPPHDHAAEQVLDHRQVEPPLGGRHVCDVRTPRHVWAGRGEVPVQDVLGPQADQLLVAWRGRPRLGNAAAPSPRAASRKARRQLSLTPRRWATSARARPWSAIMRRASTLNSEV